MDLYSLCSIAASLLPGIQVGPDASELSVVAGAAAQVACQESADLIVGGIGVFPEQGNGIHHEAGVAEATLVSALTQLTGDASKGVSAIAVLIVVGLVIFRMSVKSYHETLSGT